MEEKETRIVRMEDTAELSTLSSRQEGAMDIVKARIEILDTLRRAALSMTAPEDWVLFRARDGRVVGYLSDAGCQRVRDLYGIEIYGVSDPVIEPGENPGEFYVMLSGSGRCRFTGQVVEGIWGGRGSDEEFNRGKSPIQKRLDTLKAARANLDGQITRELAGLNSVPLEEIEAAWEGTSKSSEHCRLGRGFGSRAEREAAPSQPAPAKSAPAKSAPAKSSTAAKATSPAQATPEADQPPAPTPDQLPKCPQCGSATRYQPAGVSSRSGRKYPAFLSCTGRDCHWTANWREWLEQHPVEEAIAASIQDDELSLL